MSRVLPAWPTALALLPAVVWPMPQSRAHSQTPVSVSVTSQQVTLALSVPRRAYPRDALIPATVRIRNDSASPVVVQQPTCRADGPSPTVQVLGERGGVIFPPALPEPPLDRAACLTGPPPPLAPGAVLTQRFYIIARSDHLRATITYGLSVTVSTPTITLRLVRGARPRILLRRNPSVAAAVQLPGRRRGTMYYSDWYLCPTGTVGGSTFEEHSAPGEPSSLVGRLFNWVATSSRGILPGCDQPREWHIVVGQLGQPVAYLNFARYPAPLSPAGSSFPLTERQ